MYACWRKPGLSHRRKLDARAGANLPLSRSKKPNSGCRNTGLSGKELSTHSNVMSAKRKTRRTSDGNAAIETATGLAAAKTHVRSAGRQSVPRLDRRQAIRAVVSSEHRSHHHRFANGLEGGRGIQPGDASQERQRAQAERHLPANQAAREAGVYLAVGHRSPGAGISSESGIP